MLKGKNSAITDFYKFVFNDVCSNNYDEIANAIRYLGYGYEIFSEQSEDNNCVFIETVISGRASNTILKSMEIRHNSSST